MSYLLVAQRALTVPGWAKDALWRSARAIPSLDLRFADNKSLVDAITGRQLISFARASSGTYTDSAGVLRTAVTNLKPFSDAILTANAYSATNATLATVTVATPTTSSTATLLTLNVGANTGNNTDGFNYGSAITLTNSTQHAQSLFVKPAGATVLRLRSNVGGTLFDFTLTGNGTAPSPSLDLQAASIVAFANGWYRVSWTFTATTSAPGNRGDYWTIKTNVADGTNGLYVVGAQLEQSSTVGEYIPTGSTINSAPRFDHNPLTGESLGLLVEEQRTNLRLNSATYQPSSGGTPAAYTVDQVAPDGTTTGSRQTAATPRTFEDYTGIANALYTFSFYCRVTSGTAAFSIQLKNAASDTVITSDTSPVATTAWRRFTISGTTAGATPGARVELVGVVPGFVLWGAQLEAGATATSYIPTTTAAATRSADVVSITGTNFSSWYRQDEGTFYYEGTISQGLAGFPWLYSINDGTTSNDIGIYQFTNGVYGYVVSSGVPSTPDMSVLFSPVPGSLAKHALAVKTADSRAALNAALSVEQASTVMQVVNTLNIGRRTTGNRMTGTIRRLTYWPQALPGQLQAITQP